VYAGQPTPFEEYESVVANGVTVYLRKDALIAPEGLNISMTGEGVWRSMKIEGLQH
jgi:hypothetical protein